MQKGQIVRKQLSNGTPIGPYCKITGFAGYKCSLVRVESLDGVVNNSLVKRERIYVLKSAKMIIGDTVYKRIEKGLQTSIIHDLTPKWKSILDKQPEVIQLRNELYQDQTMLFPVEEIKRVYYGHSMQVRLDLGVRIL